MAKTSLYTDDNLVATMVAEYKAQANENQREEVVKKWSKTFNTTEVSVRAKLGTMGVYIPKVRKNKRGQVPITRERLVEELEKLLKLPVGKLNSLDRANKSVIELLYNIYKEKM